jgi:hypothetical protein
MDIKFNLNPFEIVLPQVDELVVRPIGSYRVAEDNTTLVQDVYYELWHTSDEGNRRCAESGNKTIPFEYIMLMSGQLTGTLTEEQKGIINQVVKGFHPSMVIDFSIPEEEPESEQEETEEEEQPE